MASPTQLPDDLGGDALAARDNKSEEQKAADKLTYNIGVTSFGTTNTKDSGAMRYPKAVDITKDSDYVSFEFYKYSPPFNQKRQGNQQQEYNMSISDDVLGEKLESILMYMPEDIQSEYGANWGAVGFGLIAKEIMAGAVGNFDLGSFLESAGGGIQRKLIDSIVSNANKALGTSVTTNQALGATTGKVVNPNVEMMYEAPEMRTFSLSFKMFASSPQESTEIRKICNTFKKNMLPNFGGQFIDIPNIVKVTFMTGSSANQWVSQFKPCAISNVSINYTPDGSWATYGLTGNTREGSQVAIGAPVATTLTIQFKELKMLFQNDITVDGASY